MPEDVMEPVVPEAIETAAPVEPEPIEPQEPVEPTEPTEPELTEPEPQTPGTGVEPLPKDVQKFLREARQTPENAAIARQLQDSYYGNRAYKEQFPTVEDARIAKATIDAMGGADGIIEMRRNAEVLEDIDSSIENGDPHVIEDAIESYPEGAARLIEHGLSLLERTNPDAYAQMLRGPFVRSLLQTGIADRISYAMEALEAGQTEFATRQISAVYQHLQRLAQESQTQRQAPPAQAQERQAPSADREISLNRREFLMNVGPYLESSISSELSKLNGEKALAADAKTDLLQRIADEIDRSLGSDRVYQTNMDSYLRRGQIKEAINYARVHIDKARGQAAREIWTKSRYSITQQRNQQSTQRTSSPSSPVQSPKNGKGSPEAPIQVAKRPESKYIDYDKTDTLFIMSGKAYLTDGRFVQWKRK